MPHSIRKRLGRTLLGLSIIPVLVVEVVVAYLSFDLQRDRAIRSQEQTAETVAAQVEAFIGRTEHNLSQLIRVSDILALDATDQRLLLSELLSQQDDFDQLTLLDREGLERVRVSREGVGTASDLRNRAEADEFRIPRESGTTYLSPLWLDETTGESMISLGTPLMDADSGNIEGVVVGDVRLTTLWNVVADIPAANEKSVFLVDAQSRIVAHKDPSVVLSGAQFRLPDEAGIVKSASGPYTCVAFHRTGLGQHGFTVVVEQALGDVMGQYLTVSILMVVCVILPTIIVAYVVGRRLTRSIVGPIEELSSATHAVEVGALSWRTTVASDDEIGDLSESFNKMTAQLEQSFESLENEVAERRRVEEELREHQEHLEELVEERTQALQESRERYRAIFEQAADSVVLFDTETGAMLEFNDRAHENLGYTREEFEGITLVDIEALESPAETAKHIEKLIEEGADVFETKQRRKNGELRDIAVSSRLIDVRGRKLIAAIWQDITERKRAQQALRESEKRYRAVVDAQTELICRFLPGKTISFVNEAYCRYFGKKQGELVGQSFLLLIPEGDRKFVKNHIDSLSPENPVLTHEHRVVKPTGETGWQQWTNRAIFDEQGRVTEYQSVGRDITERKRSEEALRKSEERFRQVAENAKEWIWEVDTSASYTYASPVVETILGYKPEEIVGKKHFYDFSHPEDLENLKKATFGVFAKKQPFRDFVIRKIDKHGNVVWLSTSGIPILDEDGNLAGYRGVDVDITVQKQAQQALESSHELLRSLSARLADTEEEQRRQLARDLHDGVGQTLAVMGINLNFVRDHLPINLAGDVMERLDDALKQVEEVTAHIRDVMSELVPPMLKDYGLLAALRWHCEQYSRHTGISTYVQGEELVPRPSPKTETALLRIIQEAMTNTAKHAQASMITITVEQPAAGTRVAVADDGVGMNPAVGNGPEIRRGWGMLMMQERAAALGGEMRVESEPGQGTRVVVECKARTESKNGPSTER